MIQASDEEQGNLKLLGNINYFDNTVSKYLGM